MLDSNAYISNARARAFETSNIDMLSTWALEDFSELLPDERAGLDDDGSHEFLLDRPVGMYGY